MEKKNNYEVAARGIRVSGFAGRLFGYVVFYVPITLMWIWISTANGLDDYNTWGGYGYINKSLVSFFVISIMFLPTTVPFIFWERSIRSFRRKHNLSVWNNVSAELEQMAIDERVAKEHKAYINNGIAHEPSGDKKDIGYWFGLLEKGAITQVEYEAKKKELL